MVYDFGRIFQKVVRPYVAPDDETLDQALNRFVAYYEQSEMFDLYTHGTGPGLLGVVVNLLKSYLGGCVKSKLERHHTLDPTLPCPLTSYVDKIGDIVKMVVCEPEDGELPSGRLKKLNEPVKKDEEKKKKKKHKSNVKFTERKSSKQVSSEDASDDSDAALVVGSSDEEDFTTLTSGDGRKQYRPPDQTRSEARFGAKKTKGDTLKGLKQQLGNVTRKMSNYKTVINRLTKEVDEQRKKLDAIGGADNTTKRKPGVSSEGRIGKAALQTYGEWELRGTGFDPSFVGTQLRQDLESNSEEVQVIEDPEPTTGVGKKKKKKKKRDIEVVETGDDDEEDDNALLGKSQTASASKRIRRISSEKSENSSLLVDDGVSKRVESEGEQLPDIPDDKDLEQLRQERDEVEEKLKEMSRKLEAITWDDKARCYHDAVRVWVQRYHKALMNNLGKGEESEEVKEHRSQLERCTVTQAADGFKIGVCQDFIERVEKTIYVGEVPENKLTLNKIDNTVNNIVEGFVRDVTYELGLPLVVKQEKVEKPTAVDDDDDDDLEIVGYTEATIKPVAIQEVKMEPPSPPPASPKNPAEKEVRAPEEHGTPRKEVPEVSEAESVTPRNKAKKTKGVSKATEEGESSVQSTPTKEQTEVKETEMDTQDIDIDIENTESPEKSDAKKAKRSKKTVKSTEDCTRRVTRSYRPK